MSTTRNGQLVLNNDEIRAQRNEEGVLRALPVSPEEEARDKQTQEKIKQEKRITINHEKRKESAWTETKLNILAEKGAYKRISDKKDPKEADMPAGSIQEGLEKVGPIFDEDLGEPREFTEDINIILNGFENEILVIEGNEMQQLNEYGKKYLLGRWIQKHIFEKGFSISVDTDNQPTLRDEKLVSDTGRQEQMRGLQDALKQFEFSHSVRHILKKNDNSSLVADYIAASTHKKQPNLVDYRNSLARKMGITSPNISPEQAQAILESTSLTPEEKSFLLAWKDSKKDGALTQVQKQQETFVKYAKENIDKKTPEMHLKELAEKPFTKSAQLLAGGAIGAALLYFAYKQIKKGGIWGTISGIIAGLIGGSIMLPLADKGWQASGWGDSLKNGLEGKPVDIEQAKDNPFANFEVSIAPIKTNLSRLQARLAGGKEGIEILMNKEVGNNIATQYPVYSMLNSLDPDKGTPGSNYQSPDETTPEKDIGAALEKLQKQPNQKAQLNTLLKNTWERYKKTPDYASKNEQEKKKVTLKSMLAVIETEDGWLNTVIDTVSSIPEKEAAMRVIGQNPAAWAKIPLKDIKQYFLNLPENPGADWKKNHPTISPLLGNISNSTSILTNYFKTMEQELKTSDNTTNLQAFLLKS